ncbi:MAG: hypothetical protein M1828_002741 [Chrysothrix sp. TS-e1954]|nr:MAG: hypothetical protein M1828_002741 [Chrysothrix sp. TS-e1954]
MAKTKPLSKRTKKRRKGDSNMAQTLSLDEAPALIEQATVLLHQGEPEEALRPITKALKCLTLDSAPLTAPLPALELLGEIHIERGDIEQARDVFMKAALLDPHGMVPESKGGGADKFLWLAQLSEKGGADSVEWFYKGITVLRRELADVLDGKVVYQEDRPANEAKMSKLASALCAVAEVYMTDLSWDEDAEKTCEALVLEAVSVSMHRPEAYQTLASVRISQKRHDEARQALQRSMEMWQDLAPEHPDVPDYSTRISLSRLLMEVGMMDPAIQVLDRLTKEDDGSVEAWYLGGWCYYLMAEERLENMPKDRFPLRPHTEAVIDVPRNFSRFWLLRSLKLYDMVGYEDDRLQAHAQYLVKDLTLQLCSPPEEDGWEPLALSHWEDLDDDVNEEESEGEDETCVGKDESS